MWPRTSPGARSPASAWGTVSISSRATQGWWPRPFEISSTATPGRTGIPRRRSSTRRRSCGLLFWCSKPMPVHITIIGSVDRKFEDLVRSSGLRPTVASAVDLLTLTRAGAVQPDLLIVDVRAHGQVPAAVAALKRQHPTTSVLLAALELTPALMLDAMRAGVNECVAEPLTTETVGSAITRVLAQRAEPVGGQ